MCSIVASFDLDKVRELAELNAYRGAVAHSFTAITPDGYLVRLLRGNGGYDRLAIPAPLGCYYIVHQQAPTDTDPSVGIHPAPADHSLTWHNGILKPSTISTLQKALSTMVRWDTNLLGMWLDAGQELDERIDGSFACLRYVLAEKALYAFRNEIAPLFIDADMTISSTKAEGLSPLPPNKMYKIDLRNRMTVGVGDFVTANNPYFMPGVTVGNEPQGPDRG